MSRKKVLALCSTLNDKRELIQPHIKKQYDIIFHHYDDGMLELAIGIIRYGIGWIKEDFDLAVVIQELVDLCRKNRIEGIITTEDYPGSIFASIIAHKLNLSAPEPQAVLTCQHKYYARCKQKELVPEATPEFELFDFKQKNRTTAVPYPFFIKPVKSFFSIYADTVNDRHALDHYCTTSQMPDAFLYQFNWFIKNYTTFDKNAQYALIEEYADGAQVTLEGFVYKGVCTVLGIIDSIMFPGTICFERFEYPSSLPECVQKRMADIASRYMIGIGFNNGFFNIEYKYNAVTDAIRIIEVNPRMCSQFADLFEKVDGVSTYQHAITLALAEQPVIKRGQGIHAIAASFVLRTFSDAYVESVPTEQDIAAVKQIFPDARVDILTKPGTKLSDTMQDGKSYRYGLIHLGGKDKEGIYEHFEHAKQLLPFTLRFLT